MKIFCALTSFFLLLVISISASAALQPSFYAEASSWLATDIVVVTEEKQIDGVFKILEIWKGDLRVGQRITVAELAKFKAREARQIHTEAIEGVTGEYATGDRMILFLRDAKKVRADADDDLWVIGEPPSDSRWQSATSWGHDVKYSTVWIENGKVYCFIHFWNSGDSVLSSSAMTEAELKETVSRVLDTQQCFDTALAISDPDTRSYCLEPFARDPFYLTSDEAFAALADCGEAALPVLRRMLEDESIPELHGTVIEAFAKAGRKAAGPELTAWLERELAFWKQIGPTLQIGWWNGKGFGSVQMDAIDAAAPLHYSQQALHHAVYALGAIRYDGAAPVLIELSDFWRSLPQLYEDEVSHACDDVIRYLGANRKLGRRPRTPKYEIYFTGNKVFATSVLTEKVREYVSAYDELVKEQYPNQGSFEYALYTLRDFIWSQGYVEAQVQWERQTTKAGEVISVTVDEGKQYRLGEIRIKGAKVFSPARIRAMLNLREGDIADSAAIEKWDDDLTKAYHDLGYLDCYVDEEHEVRKTTGENNTDVVDFNITINARTRYRVASIKFEGATEIPEAQLIGALRLRKGAVFSQTALDDSIVELNKLGLALEQDMDVAVVPQSDHESMKILIVLNKERRPEDSFGRSIMKRRWYL